jgi:transcriptional regulator with XRE-family HTH domain
MQLSDYLTAHGLSYAEFARTIGVKSDETVRRYANRERIPSTKYMQRIAEATGHKVTANDFFEIAA